MLGQVGVYDIEGWVAQRPDGGVCRARDRGLGRVVALKRVANPASPAAGQLRAEARMLAGLTHPHIVSVFDLIENPGGLWLVEEWVDGASLFGVIARSNRLTPTQGIGVVHAALEGLAYVHGRGVAHGDVTLGNILVDRAGVSKLVDFGLARPIWKPTQTGWAVAGLGTPGFASPQIVQGQPATPADDVYSAAVVLASLLLGRALFTGTTPQAVLAAQFHSLPQGPPDLAGISPNVRAVLTTALAAERADRYPDASPFLVALDDAAERDHGPGWLAEASLAGVMAALGGAAVTAARGSAGAGTAAPASAAPATAAAVGSVMAVATGQVKSRGRAGRIAKQARRVSTAGHGAVAAAAVVLIVAVVATVAIVKPFSGPPGPVRLTSGQQRPSAATKSSTVTAVKPSGDCGRAGQDPDLHLVVTAGKVSCAEAQQVLAAYEASAAQGSGSGLFATVQGWECHRTAAPEFQQTGEHEICQRDDATFESALPGSQLTGSQLGHLMLDGLDFLTDDLGKGSTVFNSDGRRITPGSPAPKSVDCQAVLQQGVPLGSTAAGANAYAFAQYLNLRGDLIYTEALTQFDSSTAAYSALTSLRSGVQSCTGQLRDSIEMTNETYDEGPGLAIKVSIYPSDGGSVAGGTSGSSGVSSGGSSGSGRSFKLVTVSIVQGNVLVTLSGVQKADDTVPDMTSIPGVAEIIARRVKPVRPQTPATSGPMAAGDPNTGPAAVVKQYLAAELAGDSAAVCQLTLPVRQDSCQGGGSDDSPRMTSTIQVGTALVQGTHALVAVVGKICVADPGGDPVQKCKANTDATSGMPATSADFETAFHDAEQGAVDVSPVPCELVDGKWQVWA